MGRNAEQRLRESGIEATRVNPSRLLLVPVTDLWTAPKGHALFDPRSDYQPSADMIENMIARVNDGQCPNTDAILVRDEPQEDGSRHLHVCDGAQRKNALLAAQRKLGATLKCIVEFFDGDDAAFLRERIRRNDHDRFTRKDSASVLAFRVKQLFGLGSTAKEIADACPKGVGTAEVDALARWGNLTKEARERFDAGAPLALLAAVLDGPRDAQVTTLDKLLRDGVRTAKGATRRANKARDERDPWARRMTPRAVEKLADAVEEFGAASVDMQYADETNYLAIGMRLAAGLEPRKLLAALPKPIADAIREARAGKKGAAK